MFLEIEAVLSVEAIDEALKLLTDASFGNGRATAGWQAREVKNNEQADSDAAKALCGMAERALLENPVFRAAAQPKKIIKTLLSRYRPGMAYGTHIDDAIMAGHRTDLAFTVFLSDPQSYEGGELVVEGNDGEASFKLAEGNALLYPATTLHRVNDVTRGERLAIAGWVRSLIRSAEDRDILFDLENAVAVLRQQGADRTPLNALLKVKANLLRKWAED
jgi:PKHD-type hydroxylase